MMLYTVIYCHILTCIFILFTYVFNKVSHTHISALLIYLCALHVKVGHLDKAMVTKMVSLLLSEDPTQILVLDPETGTALLHQACHVGHTSCVKLMVNKVRRLVNHYVVM